jgi:hypothetical protein
LPGRSYSRSYSALLLLKCSSYSVSDSLHAAKMTGKGLFILHKAPLRYCA